MKRKRQLLMILGVLLIAALFYAYLATPGPRRAVSPQRIAAGPAAVADLPDRAAGQPLLLERLQRQGELSAEVERDLFSFYVRPQLVRSAPTPPAPVVRPAPVVPVAPPEPPAPRQPMVTINYLGLLKKAAQPAWFFLEVDNTVVVTRLGQRFGSRDQYAVKSFDGETLVIDRGEAQADITLRVGEPARVSGSVVPGRLSPGGATMQPDTISPRPANLPRLKSFKIRDPAATGQ